MARIYTVPGFGHILSVDAQNRTASDMNQSSSRGCLKEHWWTVSVTPLKAHF